MHYRLVKYFSIFILMTTFIYSGGNINLESEEEEVKDTIVVHGMVLHGKIVKIIIKMNGPIT